MDESVNTGNSATDTGTTDTTAAGTSIENIMGSMAGEEAPEVKPGNGENTEGTESTSQQAAELPAWTSQLSDEVKNNTDIMKQLAKFGKITDLAKSYSELESKLGKSIVKPGKESSAEEIEAFYQSLGKPKTAEEYSIKDENSAPFKALAYKNNLSDEQAKGIYEAFQEIGRNAILQQRQAMAATAKATDDALKAEWGKDYNAKIQMLQRGVDTYGGKALGEKLKKTGLLFDADVIKMFVQLGEESQEAGSSTRTARGGGGYKPTSEGGMFSWIEKL